MVDLSYTDTDRAGHSHVVPPRMRGFVPPYVPPPGACRAGQREIVAATLAAGLIAADHTRPATVAGAVALMREVHTALWPQVENVQENGK